METTISSLSKRSKAKLGTVEVFKHSEEFISLSRKDPSRATNKRRFDASRIHQTRAMFLRIEIPFACPFLEEHNRVYMFFLFPEMK